MEEHGLNDIIGLVVATATSFVVGDCISLESIFFFQAEDGIRDIGVTGVQTCALPIWIVFIATWFDPPKEKQAARSLIDAGADVLFGISDSPSVLEEAAANGVYAAT